MCIIICKPASKLVPAETLRQCWSTNSDGAGFMYVNKDGLQIEKGFMEFNTFLEAYEKVANKKVVIHFRIATHGNVDEHNTHPFRVNKWLGFAHNGIISHTSDRKSDYSDTFHFNERILKPLVKTFPRFLHSPASRELIEAYIGWSKLVFLDQYGKHYILNEDKGVWDDGVWYSNTSYKPTVYPKDTKGRFTPATSKSTAVIPANDPSTTVDEFTVGTRVVITRVGAKHPIGTKGVITHFGHGHIVWVRFDNLKDVEPISVYFIDTYQEDFDKDDEKSFDEFIKTIYSIQEDPLDDDDIPFDERIHLAKGDYVSLNTKFQFVEPESIGQIITKNEHTCLVAFPQAEIVVPINHLKFVMEEVK